MEIEGYQVGQLLGRGGMGAVYQARRLLDERVVAVKVVSAEGASERFRREAEALAKVSHPSVVRVHDFGRAGERLFVVMEFVEGSSLEERLKREGPQPPQRVREWARALCGALAHAHARGVIHRDLKPDNVMVRTDGSVCLVDFGLALSLEDERLTKTGQILGTLAYAAPELLLGRPEAIGPAADVYSLGATLYALLTGQPPREDAPFGVMLAQAQSPTPPPAPRALRSSVPPDLSALCLSCLALDPAERPSLAEVEAGLQPGASRGLGTAVWLLGALALLALGLGAWALTGPDPSTRPQETENTRTPSATPLRSARPSPSNERPSETAAPAQQDWPVPGDPLAFPDAAGFGARARGGRDGVVARVTNLQQRGPGSLRAALRRSDPAQPLTVVFDVAGEIVLTDGIAIRRDRVTIAGQTAPAGGITIRCPENVLWLEGDDLVLQHLRLIRPGDKRCLRLKGRRILLDQLTLSKVFVSQCDEVTIQRSLFTGEGVQLETKTQRSRVSLLRNVFTPGTLFDAGVRLKASAEGERVVAEVADCVFYDTDKGVRVGGPGRTELDLVGNVMIAGSHYPPPLERKAERILGQRTSRSDYPLLYVQRKASSPFLRHSRNGSYSLRRAELTTWSEATHFSQGGAAPRSLESERAPPSSKGDLEVVLREAGARRWARHPADSRCVPSLTQGGAPPK